MRRIVRAASSAAATAALLLGIVSAPALADQGAVPAGQVAATVVPGQTVSPASRSDVIIVLDTSGSMADKDDKGVVKIDAAKSAILDQMQEIPISTRVGLYTYPATNGSTASGCKPATPRLSVSSSGASQMGAALGSLPKPDGDTPTSDALQQVGDYIKAESLQNATIVLVSDGESNCGANPCDTAKKLKSDHIDVTVNTVGFDISSQGQTELQCIAGAGGGTYAPAEDSAALTKVLKEQLGSGLSLKVSAPAGPVPLYEQLLDVGLTVSVAPGHAASNVKLHLEETGDLQGASVHRPYMALGNLISGASTATHWQIRPPTNPKLDGTTFRATVSADGTSPLTQDFTIKFSHDNPAGANLAGHLRDFKNVLVMGDSYSSGEGAGNVQRPYFTVGAQSEACHRTKNQYANWLYSPEQVTILACSGAVARNVYAEGQHGEPSQAEQLKAMLSTGYRPDVVFMSITGNDIGFADIAQKCATSAIKSDYLTLPSAAALYPAQLGPLAGCPASELSGKAYKEVEGLVQMASVRAFNALGKVAETFKSVGSEVPPIILLTYPDLLAVDRNAVLQCDEKSSPFQTALLSQAFKSFGTIQRQLNDAIRYAAQDARDSGVAPAYAAETDGAVPPGHNLCSAEPWFVTLTLDRAASGSPEMLHPNVQGHQAIAAAINDWAAGMGDELKPAKSTVAPVPWWMKATVQWWPTASQISIPLTGANSTGSIGYGNTVIHVSGGAPLTGVTIYAHSTPLVLGHVDLDKDGNGALEVNLQATDLPPGEHTVNALGTAADGTPAVGTVAVHLDQPFPTALWGLLALAVVLIIAALIVLRRNRRTR